MTILQNWVLSILANPITKVPCEVSELTNSQGLIDARVFLRNTYGYREWSEGQTFYEKEFSVKDNTTLDSYKDEINNDRPIYEYFLMKGRILDCGGGVGTVREFLPDDAEFVSTDPWLEAQNFVSETRKTAYTCLSKPLNFIGATAEFLPFTSESFDWVHMRSMLDHVQVVDLALLEARRVLKIGGHLLIGLYVDGGKTGVIPLERRFKDFIKMGLEFFGINLWRDHHIWHPSYKKLLKLIADNGLIVKDTYWQPKYQNMVCYVCASKVII